MRFRPMSATRRARLLITLSRSLTRPPVQPDVLAKDSASLERSPFSRNALRTHPDVYFGAARRRKNVRVPLDEALFGQHKRALELPGLSLLLLNRSEPSRFTSAEFPARNYYREKINIDSDLCTSPIFPPVFPLVFGAASLFSSISNGQFFVVA